jgi:hypothetical protein
MKWVALTTFIVLVLYTYLTLHYRKTGHAFEPHHDIKDRANTLRLLSAGFQRVTLEADRPSDVLQISRAAASSPAIGGLPPALSDTLLDQPRLPADILTVSAPPEANTLLAYPIEFTCVLPDNKQQLGGAVLYLREAEIYIVPHFEQLSGELLARTRDNRIRLNVPPGILKMGSYRITVLGSHASRTWTLEVK